MPGNRLRSIKGGKKGKRMYESMRAQGVPKRIAAATTNKWAKRQARKRKRRR